MEFLTVPFTNNEVFVLPDGKIFFVTVTGKKENKSLFLDMSTWWGSEFRRTTRELVLIYGYFNIRLPLEFSDKIDIRFSDANTKNLTLDNLFYSFKEKIEHPWYPGFYYIPYYTLHLLNDKDEFIYTPKNTLSRGYNGKCSLGYPTASLIRDTILKIDRSKKLEKIIRHKLTNTYIHRVKALVFIPYLTHPFELEVNHKDGVKTNNSIENLEWVTKQDNIQHMWKTGLRSDNYPVLVKDYKTDTVTEYYSVSEASRNIPVSDSVLWTRVSGDSDVPCIGRYLIQRKTNKPIWKFKNWEDLLVNGKCRYNPIVAKNIVTNDIIYLRDSREYKEGMFNLDKDNLSKILNKQLRTNTWTGPHSGYFIKFEAQKLEFPERK